MSTFSVSTLFTSPTQSIASQKTTPTASQQQPPVRSLFFEIVHTTRADSQTALESATAPPPSATDTPLVTPEVAEDLVRRGFTQEDVDGLALLQVTVAEETSTIPPAGQDRGSESPVDLDFFEQMDAQAA